MNTVRSDIAGEPSSYPAFYFAGPVFTGVNGWPLCMTCDHMSSWEITPESPVESMVQGLVDKTDFIKNPLVSLDALFSRRLCPSPRVESPTTSHAPM